MTSFASQFTDVVMDNVYIIVVVSDILRNEKRQSWGGFAFILVEFWHPVLYTTAVTYRCFVFTPRGFPIDYGIFAFLQDKLEGHAWILGFLWSTPRSTLDWQLCLQSRFYTESNICGTSWTGVKGRTSFQINFKSPITYRPLLNYANNIFKIGPSSCDVINTFRLFNPDFYIIWCNILVLVYLFQQSFIKIEPFITKLNVQAL